jgi:hypothetical protein
MILEISPSSLYRSFQIAEHVSDSRNLNMCFCLLTSDQLSFGSMLEFVPNEHLLVMQKTFSEVSAGSAHCEEINTRLRISNVARWAI